MDIGNLLGAETTQSLYKVSLSKGDVFIGSFEGIKHEKFFVIAGLSHDKMCICAVFINSNIPEFIYKKQELSGLQSWNEGKI